MKAPYKPYSNQILSFCLMLALMATYHSAIAQNTQPTGLDNPNRGEEGVTCENPAPLGGYFNFENPKEGVLIYPERRGRDCFGRADYQIGGLGIVLIKPTRDERLLNRIDATDCPGQKNNPFIELSGAPLVTFKQVFVCEEFLTVTGFPRGLQIRPNGCPLKVIRDEDGNLTFYAPESCTEDISIVQ